MSDTSSGNGNGGLYFIVGALVVVVGLGAFFFLGGNMSGGHSGTKTTIERSITPSGDSTTTITKEK